MFNLKLLSSASQALMPATLSALRSFLMLTPALSTTRMLPDACELDQRMLAEIVDPVRSGHPLKFIVQRMRLSQALEFTKDGRMLSPC
jgi:hypothetical protein